MIGPLPHELPISHVGVIVPDLREAMERYSATLGWGPWEVFQRRPPVLRETTLHGVPTAMAFDLAEAKTATGVGFELLQPVSGQTLYSEWIESGRSGLHHLGAVFTDRDEYEAVTEALLADGGVSLMAGVVGDAVEFHYIEPHGRPDLIVETAFSAGTDVPDAVYPEATAAPR